MRLEALAALFVALLVMGTHHAHRFPAFAGAASAAEVTP